MLHRGNFDNLFEFVEILMFHKSCCYYRWVKPDDKLFIAQMLLFSLLNGPFDAPTYQDFQW